MGRGRKGAGRASQPREKQSEPADHAPQRAQSAPPDERRAKLQQGLMFSDREITQFGVKARPQMSAERSGGGGLIMELQTQDARSPEQIEREQRAEEAHRNRRFWDQSDDSSSPQETTASSGIQRKFHKRARAKLIEKKQQSGYEIIRVGISHNYSVLVIGKPGASYRVYPRTVNSVQQAQDSQPLGSGETRADGIQIARSIINHSHALDQDGEPVYTPEGYDKMREESNDLRGD